MADVIYTGTVIQTPFTDTEIYNVGVIKRLEFAGQSIQWNQDVPEFLRNMKVGELLMNPPVGSTTRIDWFVMITGTQNKAAVGGPAHLELEFSQNGDDVSNFAPFKTYTATGANFGTQQYNENTAFEQPLIQSKFPCYAYPCPAYPFAIKLYAYNGDNRGGLGDHPATITANVGLFITLTFKCSDVNGTTKNTLVCGGNGGNGGGNRNGGNGGKNGDKDKDKDKDKGFDWKKYWWVILISVLAILIMFFIIIYIVYRNS